ncbi:MAG: hypothetical protein IKR12_01415, partial [Clostridia bacterium]|nr:hypothetical protein [Clostridia bacterium]
MIKFNKLFLVFALVFAIALPMFAGCSITDNVNEKPTFTIITSANNTEYGTVYGAGDYEEGEVVYIAAVAKDGYEFEKWNDNVLDSVRSVTVSTNKAYMAIFKPKTKYAVLDSMTISLKPYDDLTDAEYNNMKKVSKVKVKSFRVSDADRSNDYFYHSLGKIDDDIGGWLLDRTTVGGWAYQTYTLDRYLNQNSAYQNNLKLDLNKNLKDDFVFDYNFAYTLVENDTTYSGNVYTSMVSNLNIVLTEN